MVTRVTTGYHGYYRLPWLLGLLQVTMVTRVTTGYHGYEGYHGYYRVTMVTTGYYRVTMVTTGS